MLKKNSLFTAFGIYLGISPIYWMPFIPPIIFTTIKFSLFIYLCIFSIILNVKTDKGLKISLPGKQFILIPLIAMFLTVLISALLGSNADHVSAMANCIQIIFFLIATEVVIKYHKVFYVLKVSLSIISFFVILSVLLMLVTPLSISPINDNLYLINTGFGGLRTSWAPAIGLFTPFLLMISGSVTVFLIYLFSQLLTGGRSGFFLSTLFFIPLLYIEKNRRLNVRFIVISIFIISAFFIYNPDYFLEFRVFDTSSDSLDDLSSGRIELLKDAMFSISETPFLGNATEPYFIGHSVHNVFLKGWVYYGFLYFLFSISVVIYIIFKNFKRILYSKKQVEKKFYIILFLVLIYGFFIGMVEPSIIFGNFTNFSIWWFVFGLVASNNFKITNEVI